MILRLADTAEADLSEIWAYLATEAGEPVATRFLDRIAGMLDTLRHTPLIGTPREVLSVGLRVIFLSPYAVYYRVTDRELFIVRVLHGARDAAALAEQGGFLA